MINLNAFKAITYQLRRTTTNTLMDFAMPPYKDLVSVFTLQR